jgi:hypothetical protein
MHGSVMAVECVRWPLTASAVRCLAAHVGVVAVLYIEEEHHKVRKQHNFRKQHEECNHSEGTEDTGDVRGTN